MTNNYRVVKKSCYLPERYRNYSGFDPHRKECYTIHSIFDVEEVRSDFTGGSKDPDLTGAWESVAGTTGPSYVCRINQAGTRVEIWMSPVLFAANSDFDKRPIVLAGGFIEDDSARLKVSHCLNISGNSVPDVGDVFGRLEIGARNTTGKATQITIHVGDINGNVILGFIHGARSLVPISTHVTRGDTLRHAPALSESTIEAFPETQNLFFVNMPIREFVRRFDWFPLHSILVDRLIEDIQGESPQSIKTLLSRFYDPSSNPVEKSHYGKLLNERIGYIFECDGDDGFHPFDLPLATASAKSILAATSCNDFIPNYSNCLALLRKYVNDAKDAYITQGLDNLKIYLDIEPRETGDGSEPYVYIAALFSASMTISSKYGPMVKPQGGSMVIWRWKSIAFENWKAEQSAPDAYKNIWTYPVDSKNGNESNCTYLGVFPLVAFSFGLGFSLSKNRFRNKHGNPFWNKIKKKVIEVLTGDNNVEGNFTFEVSKPLKSFDRWDGVQVAGVLDLFDAGFSGSIGPWNPTAGSTFITVNGNKQNAPLMFDFGGVTLHSYKDPFNWMPVSVGVSAVVGLGYIYEDGPLEPIVIYEKEYFTEESIANNAEEIFHFNFASSLLQQNGREKLATLCAKELALLESKHSSLQLDGYTDPVGADDRNVLLSVLRATNVFHAVLGVTGSRYGIPLKEKNVIVQIPKVTFDNRNTDDVIGVLQEYPSCWNDSFYTVETVEASVPQAWKTPGYNTDAGGHSVRHSAIINGRGEGPARKAGIAEDQANQNWRKVVLKLNGVYIITLRIAPPVE